MTSEERVLSEAKTEIEIAVQNCAERGLHPAVIAAALLQKAADACDGIGGEDFRRNAFRSASEN